MIPKRIVKERIYVAVTSTFDSTGYMQPVVRQINRSFSLQIKTDILMLNAA